CPYCGKNVPPGAQICPACHYHLKLRRRMSIGAAIKTADMHSQGLNVDGSRRVTNADRAEERAEQGRKVGRGMLVGAIVFVLVLAALAANFVVNGLAAKPLANLRDTLKPKKLNVQKPENWDPLWTWIKGDEPLTLELPLDAIAVLEVADKPSKKAPTVVFPAPWPQGTSAWAAFAETVMPPAVNTVSPVNGRSRYTYDGSNVMVTLLAAMNALGGPYAPDTLSQNAPGGPVVVWRENPDLKEKGALRGALLSLSSPSQLKDLRKWVDDYRKKVARREEDISESILSEEGLGRTLTREAAEQLHPLPKAGKVKVKARLSFVPVVNRDLSGGRGTYAQALTNGAAFVRDPASDETREPGKLKGGEDCYFLPVLVVDGLEKVEPAKKKTTKKRGS
ncbi:MAG: zinc ribbon domain-containing protein, partial [Planctomycetes bacterium]|nr:zinc ribbon domain-containing protein [Planctomycetota bacterium]